uniref:Uncharacterized protein n=1 Tax=Ascaris lumbricoides TaxID=6252 RepID=A0A0M3I4M0_ASCLU
MAKTSTIWIIILLALCGFTAAFPPSLIESMRLKRQSAAYVPSSCNTCGELGYGRGLGSYFYGQMGGGVNNNYGGTNIGKINVKNINA